MKASTARLAAVVLVGTSLQAAAAQDHPPFEPTRDVTVDYVTDARSRAPNMPNTMRIYLAAGGKRMRMEAPGMPGYMLMDRAASRVVMVMAEQRMYTEIPLDPSRTAMLTLNDKMAFTRKGTDTVAGLRCTVWEVRKDAAHGGTACIADDGVVLRGESSEGGGAPTHVTATAVSYATLPDSVFQPPADFRKLELPAGMTPGMMPPGVGRPAVPAR
ncbi:DUF4412 domain-containing protein [Limobrevibacterium gyesilva]|uniref:DUF4412 domain-containing protein n=1 Tax=Limobrevibacterium gyesilva TaxID=2991712 RepID=A0AA41YJN4_9PROT|nr:DUF4412 domain-containing protein [Limobrevibacterium gyesilva]MCW3474974.1 DUF4412 domain-containing protein [Limobrevibacterium gyesilva]